MLWLLVGSMENVDDIDRSDKLYRLDVDFAEYDTRQICSGIRKHYAKEQLKGRQAVFVFNLAPRTLMCIESSGMILTAQDAQEIYNLLCHYFLCQTVLV